MNRPLPGQVRVIAGTLRGSKLPVADLPGLRPTGERARETLFNWLQGEVAGKRALDLFAGSGALGFEAASRGAASVVLVERDARQAASLRDSATRLHAEAVVVECADALAWLARTPEPRFELAFLDPPFDCRPARGGGARAAALAGAAGLGLRRAGQGHRLRAAGRLAAAPRGRHARGPAVAVPGRLKRALIH